MTGLSENQRGIVQMLSTMALLIAATQIPTDIPNRSAIVLFFGVLAIMGTGLQKFLQAPAVEQQTILDSLHGFAQAFVSMSPEEQSKMLQNLPTVLPMLVDVVKASKK